MGKIPTDLGALQWSEIGSNREATLAAFMASKTGFDALLTHHAAASDDHFGVNPEQVTGADDGSLGFVTERLKEVAGFLGV